MCLSLKISINTIKRYWFYKPSNLYHLIVNKKKKVNEFISVILLSELNINKNLHTRLINQCIDCILKLNQGLDKQVNILESKNQSTSEIKELVELEKLITSIKKLEPIIENHQNLNELPNLKQIIFKI